MDDHNFLTKFINAFKIEHNRFSCLMLALTDARKLTGRNPETGQHEFNILESEDSFFNPYSFIGIINYLLILEMIGEVFKKDGSSLDSNKTNKIYKALKQFYPSIEDKDIDTIIALRNSLAHNYGLINIPNSPREVDTKQHKFTFIYTNTPYLIEYPPLGYWELDFSDKSEDTSTKVSFVKLADLVESVYSCLGTELTKGTLSLALTEGVNELKARFTIRY